MAEDDFLGALVVLTPEGEILSWSHGAEILFHLAYLRQSQRLDAKFRGLRS
jgi:hypothetical protein